MEMHTSRARLGGYRDVTPHLQTLTAEKNVYVYILAVFAEFVRARMTVYDPLLKNSIREIL